MTVASFSMRHSAGGTTGPIPLGDGMMFSGGAEAGEDTASALTSITSETSHGKVLPAILASSRYRPGVMGVTLTVASGTPETSPVGTSPVLASNLIGAKYIANARTIA
jgi:hypothetical protein